MKIVPEISSLLLAVLLLFANPAFAMDTPETTTIECKLPGCQVSCALKRAGWRSFGTARQITMTQYENSSMKFILDKGIDGKDTILVGPEGYICNITNQKN